jgi:uncharacterized protein (DUF488 family)
MIELMTIGYEKLTRENFFRLLQKNKVSMLVDVRQSAMTRRPGFGKSALRESMARLGIKYEHIAELGCLQDLLPQDRIVEEEGALEFLADSLQKERVCLMCSEADHRVCHRSVVVDEVIDRHAEDVRVRHLTA